MRVTTAFKRLLRLEEVNVTSVEWFSSLVVVHVALRRRRLHCPHCRHKSSARYDTRPVASRWRHLDLGTWRVEVRAVLRRLRCPTHGVVVEAVPFARPGAHLTRDLDDLLAWLATRMDKTAVARLCRVAWRTVGSACERVVADELDPDRLDGLFRVGVDEISWRRQHKYLTLVVDHDRSQVIWGAAGRDASTLDKFFAELGPERSAQIEAVSMDLGPAFLKSVRREGHAPQAIVCADPFHVVKLGTEALDEVRRAEWNLQRTRGDRGYARWFKGARWCLLKNPEDLTDQQARDLRVLTRIHKGVARAYELKEQLRQIITSDATRAEAGIMLDRWIGWATRSRLAPFVKTAKTVRASKDLILNAIEHGISNGRVEGMNTKVRLLVRRAYGFHSAEAALALVMLAAGPITLTLPHERTTP